MMSQIIETHYFKKNPERIKMIEIRNSELVIDGHAIGNEEKILAALNKAKKYDELKATFNGGDSQ